MANAIGDYTVRLHLDDTQFRRDLRKVKRKAKFMHLRYHTVPRVAYWVYFVWMAFLTIWIVTH